MAKVVQVRGVDDEVHAVLSRRAAAAGISLSDYVRRELVAVAQRDANEELLHRLALLPARRFDAAAEIRAMRDEREEELLARVDRP